MNKKWSEKGWIRIVEVFVAILLITGILMIVLNKGYMTGQNLSESIYENENYILRDIQLNATLRNLIVGGNENVLWEDFESSGLENVRNRVIEITPNYLECIGMVCGLDSPCSYQSEGEKDIYASEVFISGNNEIYSPRLFKILCWEG